MSVLKRVRVQWVFTAGVAAVVALATYVGAAQAPAGQTASPVTTKTIKQPIGTPRMDLDDTAVKKIAVPSSATGNQGVLCAAPVDVKISVKPASTTPSADNPIRKGVSLNMRTEEKAIWYSLVDTIPPVGNTASITVNPVRLLEGDRKVGTLISGEVKFREVVRDIPLTGTEAENIAKVQSLLENFSTLSDAKLAKLSSVPIQQFVVPGPGIQVMRARLEETYDIDGVGRDTVQLKGWIAVRHGPARPASGETELSWNTAVLDTEFVGMHLQGESDKFGEVLVTLDTSRPSLGQVGRIEIPELARFALLAKLKKESLANNDGAGSQK
jgi:hypothetical protein